MNRTRDIAEFGIQIVMVIASSIILIWRELNTKSEINPDTYFQLDCKPSEQEEGYYECKYSRG